MVAYFVGAILSTWCACAVRRHRMPGVQRKMDGEGLAKGRTCTEALWMLGARSCGCVYERERALGRARTRALVRVCEWGKCPSECAESEARGVVAKPWLPWCLPRPSVCGAVARCSHKASVAPSPPRRPDQRGLNRAKLRSLEVNIYRGFRSFGCAGQPPVRCCRNRCRRRCARNLSVACAKVAFGRIVR